ncbi:MAG TPA: hypothetical protein VF406_14970 [Thermodesulfobacteriota bacterium]
MSPDFLYFAVGALAGLVIGAGLALLVTRVTGLFRTPEEARLAREVADLRKRLERKDRAIDDMLRHAADLAGRLPAPPKETQGR